MFALMCLFLGTYRRLSQKSHLAVRRATGSEQHSPTQAAVYNYKRSVLLKKRRTCSRMRCRQILDRCLQASDMLTYPKDAEEHFTEVHAELAQWSQHSEHKYHTYAGANGPWIENVWISTFHERYSNSTQCLSDIFGPFIPLFIPWADVWANNGGRYPDEFLATLNRILRRSVPYVTVSQNDQGIVGSNEFGAHWMQNILVMSSGGYGHVPIPLLKSPMEAITNTKLPDIPQVDFCFVGSLHTAPSNFRQRIHDTFSILNSSHALSFSYYKGNEWRDIMTNSRFNLAPRGYGRSSFHLYETLQMGLIPVYLYSDEPWLPYRNNHNVQEVILSANLETLNATIAYAMALDASHIENLKLKVESLRLSHFSMEGVMHHIESFLRDEHSDLVCQAVPPSVRDAA